MLHTKDQDVRKLRDNATQFLLCFPKDSIPKAEL
jgi:hypothetical protein